MRIRTKAAAVAVLLLTAACTAEPATPPAPSPVSPVLPVPPVPAFAADVQPKLTEAMARLQLPGAIVYVDLPGRGTWLAALGSATTDGRVPMSVDDHVRVGSVTKSLTAEVVLQLADQGKLGLDDPVAKYLPQVPGGDRITLRSLLAMTAGLYNFTEDDYFNRLQDVDPARAWSVDQALATAFAHPPYFAPGAGFHYSNTNYEVLGLVAEKVGGAPLNSLYRDLVFSRLGMTSSVLPAYDDGTIPQPHPRGYMYGTNLENNDAYNAAISGNKAAAQLSVPAGVAPKDVTDLPVAGPASGGLISTVRDMAIWAKALGTGQLLKPATQTARTAFDPAGSYGLGMEKAVGGLIGHNGAVPGFQTFVGYQPATGASVVVVANLLLAPNTYFGAALPADSLAGVIQQTLLPAG
ncbi:beta-lactamase family protein [Amycolatopsis sp. NBC_00355]|uniref:serine hydrolase domain-containing protein n=1 Tax=Amycolatopsis sp. NBC_00355 TaxID=2975957 RepID=UPI002E2524F5